MRLASGDRLGPYEILSPIGAGGMGEVYRARDTRLDRLVAIKVMPEGLASSAPFRERFEREAKAISALAHPNICTVHDVGSHHGIEYLVMEHLEGETLADRLARGPLSVAEVLTHGVQIADALDKAHRRGIIHRDLKPANVMLTHSGAKLLDFGLAKPSGSPSEAGHSALTEQKPITEQGTILGTYQYMSPEQLEGLPADARTDIFAFGALLYEMATGVRAFSGKTRTSLIAAIVSAEPRAISEIQPLVPRALERLIRTCLAKDPDERWQSAHDVRLELEGIAATSVAEGAFKSSRGVALAGWIAAAVIAIAAGAWWFVQRNAVRPVAQRFRFEIVAPGTSRFNSVDGPATISPDGRHFAVRMAGDEGRQQLWLRSLDDPEFRPLRGTAGGFDPFWSPDGRQLGFFADGKLRRFDLSTSAVATICTTNDGRGASWGRDGTILMTLSSLGPIYRVPATGGTPEPATKLDASRRETAHWRPSFLPDGRRFLFIALSENSDNNGVYLGSLDSPAVHRVLDLPTAAVYAEPGYLLYVNETDLYAQPFDVGKGVTVGPGFLVARGVDYGGEFATSGFSASRNGTLVYHRYTAAPGLPLVRMPLDGEGETVLDVEGVNLDLSPDGSRVALMRVNNPQRSTDIWIYDLRRGVSSRVTFEAAEENGPVWSKDGKTIVYTSTSAGGISVLSRPSGGGGSPQVLIPPGDQWIEIVDWSPDGRTLLAENDGGATRLNLVTIDVPTKKVSPLASTPFIESSGRFSPDGKWIAYDSDESGRNEIYVQPFPPDGTKWQVSSGGGESPRWRRDGRRLFYVRDDQMLMSVDVTTAAGFEASAPRAHRRIDSDDLVITHDGREVIVSRRGSRDPQPIVVVTGWHQDVKEDPSGRK